MIEWEWSDAWVFSSLTGPGRDQGQLLWQVMLYADQLNRTMLGEGEFTVAAGRLIAAGLMEADVSADCYWLTDAGLSLREQLMPDAENYNWYDAVLPGLRGLGRPAPDILSLPDGLFRRAAKRYSKEFRAMSRRELSEEETARIDEEVAREVEAEIAAFEAEEQARHGQAEAP